MFKAKKTSKLLITCPLWKEFTYDLWIPSHNVSVMRKALSCYDVIIFVPIIARGWPTVFKSKCNICKSWLIEASTNTCHCCLNSQTPHWFSCWFGAVRQQVITWSIFWRWKQHFHCAHITVLINFVSVLDIWISMSKLTFSNLSCVYLCVSHFPVAHGLGVCFSCHSSDLSISYSQ